MSTPDVDPASTLSPVVEAPLRRPSTFRPLALATAAGLLAGLASWLAEEPMHGRFRPPLTATPGFATPAETAVATAGHRSGVLAETSVVFGLLGAALGAALGAVGGLVGRSPRRAGMAALGGSALGVVAAVAAVQVALRLGFRLLPQDDDGLGSALAIQGAIAGLIGAAAGAAMGWGADGRRGASQAAVGGLLGGVVGVVAYQVAGALAFPLAETSRPVSVAAGARLTAQLLIGGLAAAGAALGLAQPPPRRA